MNRTQFMEQLARLLSDIPADERKEALDYYESYFEDAGSENEGAVIQELGSPGKVAAIIKADLKDNHREYGEYTEHGYEDSRTREPGQMPARRRRGYHADRSKSSSKVILILILLVFLSPFIKGAVGGVLGLVAAVLLLPFTLAFGVGAGGVALIVGAVVSGIIGIGILAVNPPSGILTFGIAFLLLAIGILLCIALGWLTGKIIPAYLRKATDFIHNLICRVKKEE